MGKRILVADDSRTIQQAFAMVMDGSGYTLSFAKSIEEALSVARRDGRPDLVLSDAALGAGSGYDLCAQLKADPALREVPVYILASLQTPYDEGRARKVGADGYLAKPFESQGLLDAVASALSTPARRVSASMPSQPADTATNTSRYAEDEVIGEDEDSYGEITIERGPPAAPTPAPPAWAAKPPVRPSAARPISAPTPAPPSIAAARPPLITTPRPSTAMPAARTAATPAPTPSPPSAAQPRHTVMGFPSVRQAIPPRTAPSVAPPPAAPVAPTISRPATLPPATASLRPPVLGGPAPLGPPIVARHAPASPTLPGPIPGATARPAPRIAPPAPVPAPLPSPVSTAVPEAPLQAQTTARRPITPLPATARVEPPAPVEAAVSSVADKIEQKISALAARGPEYEAIAKLSREIIEQVVWEVVPELAEAIIRQEVDRLASAKK